MSIVKRGEVPTLFESPSHCCGCGACAAACPKGAITMSEGKNGFVLPVINSELCIGCGTCTRACGLNRGIGSNSVGPFFAAAGRDDVSESASGGVFGAVAREHISSGGVAYGAAYEREGNTLRVRHRRAVSVDELRPLLNSKYVQSDAGSCFADIKADLCEGGRVLFCGTPCQVAGLRGFLRRDYEGLTTIDLICHGVPSARMFADCVEGYGKQFGSPVVDFRFRCKREGWGHSLLLLLLEDGRVLSMPRPCTPTPALASLTAASLAWVPRSASRPKNSTPVAPLPPRPSPPTNTSSAAPARSVPNARANKNHHKGACPLWAYRTKYVSR